MKPVLIDSDILIEVTRGRDMDILAAWQKLDRDQHPVFCSPVTIAEILQGALPREIKIIDALFVAIQSVPIDGRIGRQAGDYLRQYAKSHSLEIANALIAATACVHDLAVWTRNRKHYPMRDIAFVKEGILRGD